MRQSWLLDKLHVIADSIYNLATAQTKTMNYATTLETRVARLEDRLSWQSVVIESPNAQAHFRARWTEGSMTIEVAPDGMAFDHLLLGGMIAATGIPGDTMLVALTSTRVGLMGRAATRSSSAV